MIIVLSNGLIFNLENMTCAEPWGDGLRVYFVDGYINHQYLEEKLAAEFTQNCRELSAIQYKEVESNEPPTIIHQ